MKEHAQQLSKKRFKALRTIQELVKTNKKPCRCCTHIEKIVDGVINTQWSSRKKNAPSSKG